MARKSLLAAQRVARVILEDEEYQRVLLLRARTGTLPPQVETLLYHYAYGKPVEVIEATVTSFEELAKLPLSVLKDELRSTLDQIAAARSEAIH